VYPAHLFNLFPPFPREDKVFVAMSFAPQFQDRWDNVIVPAVQELGLEPFRVDLRMISDSILIEITKSIANHRLIFGDISVMFVHEEAEHRFPVRNANVMYEVGLAHAVRLPEEVVLFRSDNEYLPFDVMNIRVNSYAPDKAPDEARAKLGEALREALREVEQSKLLAVEHQVQKLSITEYVVLLEMTKNQGALHPPLAKTMGDVLSNIFRIPAINALIERGLLMSELLAVTPEFFATMKPEDPIEKLMTYRMTPLGQAVFQAAGLKMFSSPSLSGKSIQIEFNDGKPSDVKIIEPTASDEKPPTV
jgi:hypothetical protein